MHKIAILSAGWYVHSEAQKSLEFIKECGFDAIDFSMDQYLDTGKANSDGVFVTKKGLETILEKSKEEVIEYFKPLKEASDATGVLVGQMHSPFPMWFDKNPELNEHLADVLDKCLAVCEYLGCPAIVVHPIYRGTLALEEESNLAQYRRFIPIIKKYKGIKICLENIFARMHNVPTKRIVEGRLCNARDAVELIDLLNSEAGGDYFGFCLDIGHALLTRRSVSEFIRALGNRLTVLHIHENDGEDDLHCMPYTCLDTATKNTICDWVGFVDALREIDYKGTICFESFRIFHSFPKAVHAEALKLTSAIGRYWAEQLEK